MKITVEQAKEVLRNNGYIMQFWHKDDIKDTAENHHIEITDDQINEVAEQLEDIDCNIGINWESILIYIQDVVRK
jgi:hypothetical protein